MNSFERLRTFTSKYVTLTDEEFTHFSGFFELRKFEKHQKLVQIGETEKYLNFIETGLARMYFIREKEEVTMKFSAEGEIICCYESFFTGNVSNYYSESIEPLVVLSITLQNLDKLFDLNPKIERIGRLFATQEYLKKEAFEYNRVEVNTKERFIKFIQENGNLLQRVPQKYIASYLGFTPEFLSKIRRKMMAR